MTCSAVRECVSAFTLQDLRSCVAESFQTIPGALLGRLLILEWLPFINHFSPNRELWEQQSSQRVYTAGLQDRTDGNTFENKPDVSSLTPAHTHHIFDIMEEDVQVQLPLPESTANCVLISVNVYRPCPKKNKKKKA